MFNKGNYFPGQSRDEKIILFIHRHWMSFLPWMFFIFLMIIIPVILISIFSIQNSSLFSGPDNEYLIIGVGAYALIVLAVFLTSWVDYYLDVTIVTPEHLVDIHQTGLFNRKISEQSLLRVQDVSAKIRGVLQTFFRYGTVFVETAGEAPNFEMHNIPNPNSVANIILKLHEEMVETSGFEDKDLSNGIGLEKPQANKNEVKIEMMDKTKKYEPKEKKMAVDPKPFLQNVEIAPTKIEPKKKIKNDKEGELKEGETIKL